MLTALGVSNAADAFWAQTMQRYEQRCHDIERPLLPPQELYQSPDALRERLNRLPRIEVWSVEHAHIDKAEALDEQPLPVATKDASVGQALRAFLADYAGRVLIAATSPGRREVLLELLATADLQPEVLPDFRSFFLSVPEVRDLREANRDSGNGVSGANDAAAFHVIASQGGSLPTFAITVAPLEDGFSLSVPPIAVLTERQLFPERVNPVRRSRRVGREPEAIIRDLGELSEGAPIVHEDHGVGRYRKLITMNVSGMPGEFVEIEYAKGDRLYVPVAQLHLISRYSGASPETAPLHSLGGEQWSKAKRKAAEKVRDVAAELLEIQARRQARAGLALRIDRMMYEPLQQVSHSKRLPISLQRLRRRCVICNPVSRWTG